MAQQRERRVDHPPLITRAEASDAEHYLPDRDRPLQQLSDLHQLPEDFRFTLPQTVLDRLAQSLEASVITKLKVGTFYVPNRSHYLIPLAYEAVLLYLKEAGVIQNITIHSHLAYNDTPKFFSTYLHCSSIEGKTDGRRPLYTNYAYGVGRSGQEAVLTTLGELLERFPLLLYRNRELVNASVAELRRRRKPFLDPALLAQAAPAQAALRKNATWDELSSFRWVAGRSLSTDVKTLIPAQLVYWNYDLAEGEPQLQQSTTNGAAGYYTQVGAILRGLYELVERDALLRYWLTKKSPKRIKPFSITDPNVQELLAHFKRYQLPLTILDTTSDLGIPSFVAVIHDDAPGMPAIACGGSAHHDAAHALESALLEAWSMHGWLRRKYPEKTYTLPENYTPFSLEINREERLLLWADPAMRSAIQFFLSGEEITFAQSTAQAASQRGGEESEILTEHARRFAALGPEYEIHYFAAEHQILQDLGFHTVKVIVPALLPLYLREPFAPLGAKRLATYAEKAADQVLSWVNPLPHPFP